MPVFSERQRFVALAALAQVVLDVVASVLFFAVYDFDMGVLAANPAAFPARGADVAGLLRWGGVIDMLAYLALAPVVLYLHGRLTAVAAERGRGSWPINLLTVGGLGFVFVGAIGAALWASAGPVLLEAGAQTPGTGSGTAAAAHVAFSLLATGVNIGLWGTLEWLLLGVWLIGIGWIVRTEGRAFAWVAIAAGVGGLGYDARTALSGHPPVDLTSPLDIMILGGFGLFILWVVWLAVRLWRGR